MFFETYPESSVDVLLRVLFLQKYIVVILYHFFSFFAQVLGIDPGEKRWELVLKAFSANIGRQYQLEHSL